MFLTERGEEGLDFAEGYHILEVIDENQHQDVVAGILLFDRRGQQPVLCVIIDHGFCDNHFIRVMTGAGKAFIHEGCHLIHVELDIRDFPRFNMCETIYVGHQILQSFFVCFFQWRHSCHNDSNPESDIHYPII